MGQRHHYRSSSYAEDPVTFTGAGLYDSTSAWLAGSEDDDVGPSLCDPDKASERIVNAQLGHLDVVSAEPVVFPERNLLTVEDGVVTQVLRAALFQRDRHGHPHQRGPSGPSRRAV